MDYFTDKVVIVSGSSSGIGSETAVQFAARGARVVVTGRNAERLEVTREKCRSVGASAEKVLVIPGDVTNEEDIIKIVQTTVDTFSAIHVLVNNAGTVQPSRRFEDTKADDIVAMFTTNAISAFNMTKQAMPYLLQTRGAVVNVSSIGGPWAFPDELAYCMSKAAMDQMTRCLAIEFAPRGVRVNSVNPGDIVTPIVRTGGFIADDQRALEKHYEEAGKDYPLNRVGQPSEVASTILFLASDQSSFVTGLLLPVDGGRSFCLEGVLSTVKPKV